MARKKRSKKPSEFFGPEAVVYAVFGLGIGLALSAYIPALSNLLLGVTIAVLALVLEYYRQ